MNYSPSFLSPLTYLFRLFLLILAIGLMSCAQANDNIVRLQLRWHHQFQFAGYYAALEKGFYKEEGLNVQLVAGDPKHQPVSEVLAGKAQYGEGNSEVLLNRLQGKPLVALASIFQHSPSVLLARKDSGINTVHDLIGKKVMLMNRTEDSDFLTMFLDEGVKPSDIDLRSSSYDLNDLISGKVDAFNSYLTNEPFFLQQQNIPYTVINPVNYRIDFYSDIFFTTEQELKENPKRVEAMRRATLRGWKYAMDHPDEIIDLLIRKYHVEKSREHLEFEAAEMRKLIFPDLIQMGHMNPERWQHMADTFVKAGLVKPGFTLEGFIYNPNSARLPKWVTSAFVTGVVLISFMLGILLYVLWLNQRLKETKKTLEESEIRLKESQKELEEIAYYDSLTHLPNRLLFFDRLNVAMAHSRRNDRFVAVVYLDLDGFKTVNDTYGHAVGDELLVAISKRMIDVLREEDTLGRMGGDEFIAVLGNLENPKDFEPIVERLLRAASDPIILKNETVHVSASIGVTLYPLNAQDADHLVRQADQAMYESKRDGKNRYSLFA
ncbi:ABC transporter substrate-binding protein [Sulfuricurvum sp.]|uniref:ABC transporter substrate-binding protein n=1 Tax=Sulfuricurvum sp. TaxID=2025608 RepID=UPI003C5C251F